MYIITVAPVRERGLKLQRMKQYLTEKSRSRKGAWIEIIVLPIAHIKRGVAPVRERGLKWDKAHSFAAGADVAPVRERGLKYSPRWQPSAYLPRRSRKGAWIEIMRRAFISAITSGRSRKGAWIEIRPASLASPKPPVAPVRERGLKSKNELSKIGSSRSRSRKGAWIEMKICLGIGKVVMSLP